MLHRLTRRMLRVSYCLASVTGMLICISSICYATPAAIGTAPSAAEVIVYDHDIASAKAAMLGDPVKARSLGHAARVRASGWPAGPPRDIATATAGWIEGEGAYRANDAAASGPLITDALDIARRVAPGSKLNADLLLSHARLRRESGNTQEAVADFQNAYVIFSRLHDQRSQAKTLQSIGAIYVDAQDYKKVLYYYSIAEEAYPIDLTLSLSAYNNIATALSALERPKEAEKAFRKSLILAQKIHSNLLIAQILDNIGQLDLDNKDYSKAAQAVSAGLELTRTSAAASWRPMLLGTRAKLNFAEGHVADAQRDLAAAFAQADNATTDQSFGPVHLTAYRVYKAAGDNARALEHLEVFRRMEEEGRTLAASTNAALMTARFDFVNQNARIAELKAGQLSRDVALTRLRARQSTVAFSSLLALLLTALVFLFVYLRSVRRNRIEVMRANEQLAQTNVKLGDALNAKSEFLATTSHEIRTPLNGILGMTQVMLADHAVAGTVRDRVALVDSAGRAMRSLVNDILDFAKMDSGTVKVDAAPVLLTTLLTDLVSLWRVQAQAKGVGLRLLMAGGDLRIITDGARLRQVVSNLLSNAVKFTAEGEVLVTVRLDDNGQASFIVIDVIDTGIGIPPDAYETIFEPFRQLDTSTTRQFGGTGLGLAISRHLAHALGGTISAKSDARGSIFTLRLPYLAAEPVSAMTAPAAEVLIVSDNPIRRSFLRTALERHFGTTAACDLQTFISRTGDRSVPIVVFDIDDDASVAAPEMVIDLQAQGTVASSLVLLVPSALAGHATAWRDRGLARVCVKPLRVETLAEVLRAVADGTGKRVEVTAPLMAIPSDLP